MAAPVSRTASLALAGLRWGGALSAGSLVAVLVSDAAGWIADPAPYLATISTLALSLSGSASVGAVAVGARHWGAKEPGAS